MPKMWKIKYSQPYDEGTTINEVKKPEKSRQKILTISITNNYNIIYCRGEVKKKGEIWNNLLMKI